MPDLLTLPKLAVKHQLKDSITILLILLKELSEDMVYRHMQIHQQIKYKLAIKYQHSLLTNAGIKVLSVMT
jgi:hypothetical protein